MKYILPILFAAGAWAAPIKVGSKSFTEGYLLGELAAQVLEADGRQVSRKFGLGNTGVTHAALIAQEIDVYPEYTGTIAQAILHDPDLTDENEMQIRLKILGLVMSRPLGFDNSYALAVNAAYARKNSLTRISDLKGSAARVALSHEFVTRADGLGGLQKHYGFEIGARAASMEHSLAFRAMENGQADVIDVYTTDAKVQTLGLVILDDDQNYFPRYRAVFLANKAFVEREPPAWAALEALAGTVSANEMSKLNAAVEVSKRSFTGVISEKLGKSNSETAGSNSWRARIWRRTKEHAWLVGITLVLSVAIGVPLGILSSRRKTAEHLLLGGASLVQTIPSLALMCLLIPAFGIGLPPALAALFLYSLLPVILNTHVGLKSIDPQLTETALALGLGKRRTLLWIELPLASRSILAGIKTSLITGIGTSTLAALIGAGGYGALIVSGLAINDLTTILAGAIPAALMALSVHVIFIFVERAVVPD